MSEPRASIWTSPNLWKAMRVCYMGAAILNYWRGHLFNAGYLMLWAIVCGHFINECRP